MKKMRLAVEELHVESFGTDARTAAGGTVNAHALTLNTGCNTCGCSSAGANCFCTENLSCRCQ